MWCPKFKPGDKVFAKMRGYPPWPASVEGVADENPNKMKYHVYFYGTKQMAICREEQMYSYIETREKYGQHKKYNKRFNESVHEIDTELGLLIKPNGSDLKHELHSQPLNGLALIAANKNNELLRFLKLQEQLLDIQVSIQRSLNTECADPDSCLKCLEKLFELELNTLILKKLPELIDMLIKLQTYYGETSRWCMTDSEFQKFTFSATSIRGKAKLIYDKIQSMFQIPYGKKFEDFFQEELVKFNSCIKKLGITNNEFLCLTTDPTS